MVKAVGSENWPMVRPRGNEAHRRVAGKLPRKD